MAINNNKNSNMKRRIVKTINGVAIVIPSETATLESINKDCKEVEGYVSHKIIEENDIPSDRVFRNSWKYEEDKIGFDLPKCREEIRKCRNEKLEMLDKEAFAESRKPVGAITIIDIEAQRLRDIPSDPKFNSIDINDLKDLIKSI